MDYEQDMFIDENLLDVELLEQASKMVKYSYKLAEAKRDKDIAKEKMDFMRAQKDKAIRDAPEKFGLAKITENAVNNAILMEDQYKETVEDYNDANFEVNVLQGVVSALDHRKSMLEKLVQLHGQQYFAGPATPHDLSELREQRTNDRHHRIGASMTRKSKTKK